MRIKEEAYFWQREQQLQRLRGSWRHKEMVTEKLVVSGEVWGHGAGKGVGGAGNRLVGVSGELGPCPGTTAGGRETGSNCSLRRMIQMAAGSERLVQGQDRRPSVRGLHLRGDRGNDRGEGRP